MIKKSGILDKGVGWSLLKIMIALSPTIRKANIVADIVSRKGFNKGKLALLKELRECKAILNIELDGNLIAWFQAKPTLEEEIVKFQSGDPVIRKLAEEVRC